MLPYIFLLEHWIHYFTNILLIFFGYGIFHYYIYIEGILHIFLHHGIVLSVSFLHHQLVLPIVIITGLKLKFIISTAFPSLNIHACPYIYSS